MIGINVNHVPGVHLIVRDGRCWNCDKKFELVYVRVQAIHGVQMYELCKRCAHRWMKDGTADMVMSKNELETYKVMSS